MISTRYKKHLVSELATLSALAEDMLLDNESEDSETQGNTIALMTQSWTGWCNGVMGVYPNRSLDSAVRQLINFVEVSTNRQDSGSLDRFRAMQNTMGKLEKLYA